MPHENTCSILIFLLARPRGIEPLTKNLEGSCSIQLSYGRIWHGAEPSRVAHNIEIAPHAVKLCRAWPCPPQKSHRNSTKGSAAGRSSAADIPPALR